MGDSRLFRLFLRGRHRVSAMIQFNRVKKMSDTAARKQTSLSASAPPDRPAARCEQAVQTWIDMLDAGTRLLRAGLRREVGPSGDVDAAYRRWYAARMQEHHCKVKRLLQRLRDSEVEHAG